MADETVSIQLLIDTSKSATNMAELEESIEAMREELRKTEIGSKEFDKLARSIQQAENKVKDIELTYESADLEGRFGRLGDVIGGVARGAAAVEGALFLMGEQGEEAEEVMAKLMSAMAIADSIEGFAKLGSAMQKFTSFTNIAAIAQKALGVAMKVALGPIGLIIAGITVLGAVVYKFREQIESVVRAIPGLSDALEWLGLISSEQELAAQKAVDAAKKEIAAINEKVKAIEKARDQELEAIDDTIREIDRELKVRSAAGEDVSALERTRIEQILERVRVEKEATEQIIKLRQQEIAELRKLDSNFYRAGADALEKANKERIEKVEELGEKEKDVIADLTAFDIKKQKERTDAARKAHEEALKLFEERKKLNAEIQAAEILQIGETEKRREEAIKKQIQQYKDAIAPMQVANEELVKNIGVNAQEFATLWQEHITTPVRESRKLTTEDMMAIAEASMASAEALANGLTSLSEIIGSETKKGIALQKAAAITQILVDTARGISGAIAAGAGIPFPANIPAILTGVTTVLSGIAQAKAVLSQAGASVNGTGGGGGGVGLRGPNSPGQANMLPATGETVLRGNQMDTKVVVVESDITNVQSRVNVIENQAKVR